MPPLFIAAVVLLLLFFTWRFIKSKNAAAGNIQIGQDFLSGNANKEGIKTTQSGLQYEVLTSGEGGQHPGTRDQVTVHYHGTLLNGTVFDSSVERGQSISFALNQVIPGWTEGLMLMVVGDKMRFYIPSSLAYGNRGAGTIPPGSTLIFEVELLAFHS